MVESERELEVFQLIAEGLTNPEIAASLYLSLNTVKVHTRNIYGELGAHNRAGAVARGEGFGNLALRLKAWVTEIGIGSKQNQRNRTGQQIAARFFVPSKNLQLTP